MLEKILKNINMKNIIVSSLLFLSCATNNINKNTSSNIKKPIYKTISNIEEIDYSKPSSIKEINYDTLSWIDAIKQIKTPEQAQDNFFEVDYNIKDKPAESFKTNHYDKKGVCIDYASSAAALLIDNNFPSLMLVMVDFSKVNHAVFLYRTKQGYGGLGIPYIKPKYKTVENLVKDFNKKYNTNFSSFFIADLNKTFPDKKWIYDDNKLIYTIYGNQPRIKIK